MSKPFSVIGIADTHINSTLAHWPLGVQLDDGNFIQRNVVQQFLANAWEETIEEIMDLTNNTERILVLNGDLGEMDDKKRSWQLMQMNAAITVRAMKKTFYPVMDRVSETYILRGTEAHTGKSAMLETMFADNDHVTVVPDRMAGQPTWWHLRAIWGGVRFDICHHANMGSLPWTFANAANKLAVTTMMEYHEWGEKPPHIALRAHNHRFAESGKNFPVRGVFQPGFQWKTAYLHRIGLANSKPHIGAVVFICDGGEYEMHLIRKEPRRPRIWNSQDPEMNPRLL